MTDQPVTPVDPGPLKVRLELIVMATKHHAFIADLSPGIANHSRSNPKGHAAWLVRASNNHKALVEALERSLEVMEFAYMNAPKQPKEIEEARAVLSQVKT